mgnify:CR=1 FL=1
MNKDEIVKELEIRDAAALAAYEEARNHGGPCEVLFMRGRWLAIRELLEDIKRRD